MKIGILGGGQLARMLFSASIPLNIEIIVFSDSPAESTQSLCQQVIAPYTDLLALEKFLNLVDVVTVETENIPIETLETIQKAGKLSPSLEAIACAQDRLFEKKLFNQLDIPTNRYLPVESYEDVYDAAKKLGYPFMLKARRFGYDGKKQFRITHEGDILALKEMQEIKNYLAESFVSFDREISVIAVRNTKKEIAYYDICENQHEQGILIQTQNHISDPLEKQAREYITRVLEHFNYVGVLAFEFFVKDNTLVANELAPRVHNSGHWTIEGAYTSQFENHLRAIAGFPLGNTDSLAKCTLQNIIGLWPEREKLLAQDKLKIHDYGKSERAHRKLGHTNNLTPFK